MRKRKLALRSKRPLLRRLKLNPLRKRRRDPRLPFPRRLTQLVSMVLPELKSNPQEVAEVAVEVVVAREEAAAATEVAEVATEVATEAVAERDVDLDQKARRAREDLDPKVDSVVAEAKDPKVPKVKSAQDPKVDSEEAEAKDMKVPKVKSAQDQKVDSVEAEAKDPKVMSAQDPKVDSVVAEAKDPKVLKARIAQEPKEAEAEDPPELREKVPELKVMSSKFSAPEERELSAMVSTASRARRESNSIPLTERTEPAEAEVSLKVVLERPTGELLKRKSSRLSKKSQKVRLPLRKRRKSQLPKRKLRLLLRKRESPLRRISTLTNLPLLSTLLRRRRQLSRKKEELTKTLRLLAKSRLLLKRKRRLLASAALLRIRKSTMLLSVRVNSPTCFSSRVKKSPSTRRELVGTGEAAVVAVEAAEAEAAELVVTSPVRVADNSNSELMIMPSLLWLESIEE
jgi:hypothetical protein